MLSGSGWGPHYQAYFSKEGAAEMTARPKAVSRKAVVNRKFLMELAEEATKIRVDLQKLIASLKGVHA
jgi:hypothetical protein